MDALGRAVDKVASAGASAMRMMANAGASASANAGMREAPNSLRETIASAVTRGGERGGGDVCDDGRGGGVDGGERGGTIADSAIGGVSLRFSRVFCAHRLDADRGGDDNDSAGVHLWGFVVRVHAARGEKAVRRGVGKVERKDGG